MGLNHDLCAIFTRENARWCLRELAEILCDRDRARLADLEWLPATTVFHVGPDGTREQDGRGVADLREDDGSFNHHCLSLSAWPRPEWRGVVGVHDEFLEEYPSFGCMWTSFHNGAEYAFLQMTAATTHMSAVMTRSPALWELWRGFAERSSALVAYLDRGGDRELQIYPGTSDIVFDDSCTLEMSDEDWEALSVDRMVRRLRALNGF